MLTHFEPFALLAADFGWVKVVFLLVFFVIWIFNNLLGDKAKAKPRPQRQQIPPPQPDLPDGNQPGGQQQLVGEIEEFLKRASQKRQERTRRKQPAKVVVKAVPPAPPKPARRLVQSGEAQQDFEVSQGRSVAEHVQQHLDTQQFAERAAHLVDDIAKSDTEREAHHKQVFDHKLGRLADTSTAAAVPAVAADGPSKTEAAAAGVSLATLLTNPQNLKQAIVLNEILSRPEHRW